MAEILAPFLIQTWNQFWSVRAHNIDRISADIGLFQITVVYVSDILQYENERKKALSQA